jgi:hypothetical protein
LKPHRAAEPTPQSGSRWVGPTEAPERAEVVSDDRKRGIRIYGWTYDSGHHLFYLQDTDGNENFHVFVVDPFDRVTRDLTPFDGIRAGIAAVSRIGREHVLVTSEPARPQLL